MSLRRLLQGILGLSLIGLAISLYLTYIYTSGRVAICLTGGGCDVVQHSPFAWILGIPIPTLGAGAYFLLILLALLGARKGERQATYVLALFGVSLVGLLFSAYLTYVELFIIRAICSWCVISAVIQLVVFLLAVMAWRQTEQELAD